jgi:ribose/xylose/arabinose/galactoside ABC-type transport system permease subunit
VPPPALHATQPSLPSTLALLAGGLGAGLLAGLAVAASAQRRSVPSLLLTLAVLAIFVRTVVGFGSQQGRFGAGPHHLAEHHLDVHTVALVVAAIVAGRRADLAR